jgi:hypothetical protein
MDGKAYLGYVTQVYRDYKKLADDALAQVDPADVFRKLDPESNSLALIVKHLSGNLRSRWKDFLTSDGEKPDRDRDSEFEERAGDTWESLRARWEEAWRLVFAELAKLGPADLERTVTLRGEPNAVPQAIERNLAHAASHVGQIVLLAKHFASAHWRSLSIPRGQSAQFNEAMRKRLKSP